MYSDSEILGQQTNLVVHSTQYHPLLYKRRQSRRILPTYDVTVLVAGSLPVGVRYVTWCYTGNLAETGHCGELIVYVSFVNYTLQLGVHVGLHYCQCYTRYVV